MGRKDQIQRRIALNISSTTSRWILHERGSWALYLFFFDDKI